ncbi:MAG: type II toxin-antitoxin system Phd/YefM family antitoxin [Planctomycetota bacterium]
MVRAVGIKELKARLSEYVRRARAGETILVLDRDDVVAELRPPRRHPRAGGDLEETLDALAESGEVARAARAKGRWTWKVKGLGLPSGTASNLLDEVRADRRDGS